MSASGSLDAQLHDQHWQNQYCTARRIGLYLFDCGVPLSAVPELQHRRCVGHTSTVRSLKENTASCEVFITNWSRLLRGGRLPAANATKAAISNFNWNTPGQAREEPDWEGKEGKPR